MSVYLYNTKTREKEEFKPLNEKMVTMYCCGPTVYSYAHIGNLRTYIFEDLIANTLRLAGYKVKHVMNVTDVGHLTSDEDEGEDKMLVAAEKEKKSVMEIARHYEETFFRHTSELGLKRPTIICRATEHIEDMIKFVKSLEDKGFAYFSNGNVYFDTSKFEKYGCLSGQNREDLKHGARTEQDTNKRNASDFVLWFTSSKFENQILQWDSPWGRGYPGWHIECSAMSTKYLGERIDIHCGGIDHIPVHHENEIAQSEAHLGHEWVNFWIHMEFLNTKAGKMSKSTGGKTTIDSLREMGYLPMHYKYFTLTSHYRSSAVFSEEAMDGAKKAYENLCDYVATFKAKTKNTSLTAEEQAEVETLKNEFNAYLFDDIKTPLAISHMWGVAKDNKKSENVRLAYLLHVDNVLNLELKNVEAKKEQAVEITPEIADLLEQRKEARATKNWAKSDEIRDKLAALGVGVKDLPNKEIELIKL
ncbi:MAG: cysteine--tRNA ligase [Alphaproteobacteria bacterium]|nr:cysteine--tRNA ligase [Alphaproteobacteria bacterium]